MSDAIRQAAVAAAKKIGERLHAGQPIWSEDVADIIERAMRKLCVQPAPIAGEEDYVAWCRYTEHSIVTCDSDDPGAFKVYRGPRQVPEETVSSPAHQAWLRERQKQDPLDPQPIEVEEELVKLVDQIESALVPSGTCWPGFNYAKAREETKAHIRAYVAERTDAATLAEHKSHVEYENELYATLVDPVAEGPIKEAEMRKQLLESARWYRQHVYDLETQLNAVAERVREAVEAEREACAQDAYGTAFRCHAKDDIDFNSGCVQKRVGIVAAIRARSKTEAER